MDADPTLDMPPDPYQAWNVSEEKGGELYTGHLPMPICPPCKWLRESDVPRPCGDRWRGWLARIFGKPVRHGWKELRFTGLLSYQECDRLGCSARRIVKYEDGRDEERAIGWGDVMVERGGSYLPVRKVDRENKVEVG